MTSIRKSRRLLQAAASPDAIPPPSEGELRHLNPARRSNWLPDPTNEEELKVWMSKTKTLLMAWLKEAQASAEDETTRNVILQHDQETLKEWEKLKTKTDDQTGTIWNDNEQQQLQERMQTRTQEREKLHESHGTYAKWVEYSAAQAAWEDFLYYENVWNRRWEKIDKLPIAKKTMGRDGRRDNGKPGSGEIYKARTFQYGTEKQSALTRWGYNSPRGSFTSYHEEWHENIIRVFRDFEIGYRKNIPDTVGVCEIQRYTQPLRRTKPRKLSDYEERRVRNEVRFPRKKRKVTDESEVEEMYRIGKKIRQNDGLKDKDMTTITWQVDTKSVSERRQAIEKERRAAERADRPDHENRRSTKDCDKHDPSLLTHHGALERSTDFPTSFESQDWGKTVSKTAIREFQIQESAERFHRPSEDESQEHLGHKDHSSASSKANGPRYKTTRVIKPIRFYQFDRTQKGEIRAAKNGRWQGRWVEGEEQEQDEYVLDQGQRIEVPQLQQGKEYRTAVFQHPARRTRLDRHKIEKVMDQLSDEEHIVSDGGESSGENGSTHDEDNEDEEAWATTESGGSNAEEDDGDLFRRAYKGLDSVG